MSASARPDVRRPGPTAPLDVVPPAVHAAAVPIGPAAGPAAAAHGSTGRLLSLELTLALDKLLLVGGAAPNALVVVQIKSDESWIEHTRTEVIEGVDNAIFVTTANFKYAATLSATILSYTLRFCLYNVELRETAPDQTSLLGSAECLLGDILSAADQTLSVDIVARRSSKLSAGVAEALCLPTQGTLIVSAASNEDDDDDPDDGDNINDSTRPSAAAEKTSVRSGVLPGGAARAGSTSGGGSENRARDGSASATIESIDRLVVGQTVKRNYRFPTTQRGKLKVTELMGESIFFLTVPLQLMAIFMREDKHTIKALDELGLLLGPAETVRTELQKQAVARLQTYLERTAYLDSYVGSTFKPSVMKKTTELDMLAINCHIQRIKVAVADEAGARHVLYDTITHGAASAHTEGFKHGGLRRILEERAALQHAAPAGTDAIEWAVESAGVLRALQTDMEDVAGALLALLEAFKASGDAALVRRDPAFDGFCSKLSLLAQAFVARLTTPDIERGMNEAAASRPVRCSHLGQRDLAVTPVLLTSKILDELQTTLSSMADVFEAPDIALESLRAFSAAVNGAVLEVSECISILKLKAQIPLIHLPDIVHRGDIVCSQTLTQLLTSFASMTKTQSGAAGWYRQLSQIGFLCHFESLLSTSGGEMGMLEDMTVGVDTMNNVHIILETNSAREPYAPRLTGSRTRLVVHVNVPASIYAQLPGDLRDGAPIRVFPIMFTQGVNTAQTKANMTGEHELQDRINLENMNRLHVYAARYKKFLMAENPTAGLAESLTIDKYVVKIDKELRSKKTKNLDLLQATEELTRRLCGGRLTCCKSGKDRTSMSVTLEQCNLLLAEHDLLPNVLQQALDAMRSVGVRRENLFKNIGEKRYAFNKIQVFSLPKLFRPPLNTYGSQVT